MKDFWNERYGNKDYAYGKEPNVFFAEELEKHAPGTLILPCEGEGRNAVYAAKLGWHVEAFDTSQAGKQKALTLAAQKKVSMVYQIGDAKTIEYPLGEYDVVAFIYAHFPAEIRKEIHQRAIKWLTPGGKIILEAFSPNQIHNLSGGPKVPTMLYTKAMLQDDFKDLEIELLVEEQTKLLEGEFHKGKADIIRMIATKK